MRRDTLPTSIVVAWETVLAHVPTANDALIGMDLVRFRSDGSLIPFVPTAVRLNVSASDAGPTATFSIDAFSAVIDAEAAWVAVRAFGSAAAVAADARLAERGRFGDVKRIVDVSQERDGDGPWDQALLARQAVLRIARSQCDQHVRGRINYLHLTAVQTVGFPHPPSHTWVPSELNKTWRVWMKAAINARFNEMLLTEEAAAT